MNISSYFRKKEFWFGVLSSVFFPTPRIMFGVVLLRLLQSFYICAKHYDRRLSHVIAVIMTFFLKTKNKCHWESESICNWITSLYHGITNQNKLYSVHKHIILTEFFWKNIHSRTNSRLIRTKSRIHSK